MSNQKIRISAHTNDDGIAQVNIPTGITNQDIQLIVSIVAPDQESTQISSKSQGKKNKAFDILRLTILKRIKKYFNQSKILKPTKQLLQLVKPRKYSLLILLVSAVLFLGAFRTLLGIIRIESRNIPIFILTSDNIQIKSSRFRITKRRRIDDIYIEVSYKVNSKPENDNSYITIEMPKDFQLSENNCGDHKNGNFGCTRKPKSYIQNKLKRYVFPVTGQNSSYITFGEVKGKIFSTSARELDLKLRLGTFYSIYYEYPIELTIIGLEDVNVNYISPKPSSQDLHFIKYKFLPWERLVWSDGEEPVYSQEDIRAQITDRGSSYNIDIWILLLGSSLGILSSIFASAIWEEVKQFEKK